MSVEQVARSDGTKVWRVRWRDEHGRNRSKTLGRKRDADAFDAEIRRLRRLGELGLMDAGRATLAEFGQEWLVAYAVPNLEPKTKRTYESLWDRHLLPSIGGVELRQLRPAVIDQFLAQLQRDGLSPGSVKKVAGMLQGVLQRAVEWERIAQNPMRVAHEPRARRRISSGQSLRLKPSSSGGTSSPRAGCAVRRVFPCSPTPDCDPVKPSR